MLTKDRITVSFLILFIPELSSGVTSFKSKILPIVQKKSMITDRKRKNT